MTTELEVLFSWNAFVLNLGAFVFLTMFAGLPRTRTSTTLVLLVATLVLWTAGDAVGRTLDLFHAAASSGFTFAVALVWIGVTPVGALVHILALQLSRAWSVVRHPLTQLVLWGLVVFFIAAAFLTPSTNGTFMDAKAWAYLPFVLYFTLALFGGLALFIRLIVRPPAAIVRRQSVLMALFIGIPIVAGVTNDLLFGLVNIQTPFTSIGEILSPVFAVGFTYGVARERLFMVASGAEQPSKPGRGTTAGAKLPPLEPGEVRLFLGDEQAPVEFFGAILRGGKRGIAFTAGSGIKVKMIAGLHETPVLEFRPHPGKNQLNPTLEEHREMVPLIVQDVAAAGESGGPVVLLHGYHLLAAAIEEAPRRALLTAIRDAVKEARGALLIQAQPDDLPKGDVAWLRQFAGPG